MKRIVIILLLVTAAGGLAAGWWWMRTEPEAVVELLAGGGLERERAEALVSSVAQGQQPEELVLTASGSIEGIEVAIVSEFGGRVVALHADQGDEVEAGEVLIQLDTSLLLAQVAQAQAAVAAAEANLASVNAGTHPAEILAAQAALRHAVAERDAADTTLADARAILADPQEIEARIVEARAAVQIAAVQIEQAESQVKAAEVERDRYRAQGSMEEKGLYQAFSYQVEAANLAVEAARANLAGAERTLAALEAVRDNPLVIESQVHMAEANADLAAQGVRVANARLDELQAGPSPEEVAVAEAQVARAQAAVVLLQTQIDMLTLKSPIDGIVTSRSVHAGEAALAGATLMTVADLDEVKLTIYVPEANLGRVYLGQEVAVQVDSYPGEVFTGTVSYIAQQAEFTPKNVQTEKDRVNMVFALRVRLPNPGHRLRPGMPADAVMGE
ncbi:MAG: efflux RND transporter periplasmic adaptor subunit [Anaerolineae bacterium]|nr:efflux RND transporter periplasmic adaptor subunit [Anaerolineae bacterium]